MKKKVAYVLLITMTATVIMEGCGESKQNQNIESFMEQGFDEKSEELLGELPEEIEADDEEDNNYSTYKLYDADPGWASATPGARYIQVDDVLYIPTESLEQTMAKVVASEVDYEYEYNPDELVPGGNTIYIKIFRDGKEWVNITGVNTSASTVSAKETMLVSAQAVGAGRHDDIPSTLEGEAIYYSRIIDGRAYRDIIGMNYNDAKELADKVVENGPAYISVNESSGPFKIGGETVNALFISAPVDPINSYTSLDGEVRDLRYEQIYVFCVDSNNATVLYAKIQTVLNFSY